MEDLTFDLSSKELQAMLSAVSDIRENQLCGGCWGGSAAYFLDVSESFLGDVEYLKKNLQILQRNCADVLTQVYKQEVGPDVPAGQSRSHSAVEDNPKMRDTLFADDLKFELYGGALVDLERVAGYLSVGPGKDFLDKFRAMVHARQQVYGGIVVVPLGNALITEQKAYIGRNQNSRVLELAETNMKRARQELQSSLEQGAEGVSDETKTYLLQCQELINVHEVLQKITGFRRKLEQLDSSNEEQFFQQVSSSQAALQDLRHEAEVQIQKIRSRSEQVQKRKDEETAIRQLKSALEQEIERLVNSQQGKARAPEQAPDELDQSQFNLFEDLQREFATQQQMRSIEELVYNRQPELDRAVRQAAPASTLERLFARPMAPARPLRMESEIFRTMFRK